MIKFINSFIKLKIIIYEGVWWYGSMGNIFGSFMIGFSGAMMPGPMLGVTIDGSLKRGFWPGRW